MNCHYILLFHHLRSSAFICSSSLCRVSPLAKMRTYEMHCLVTEENAAHASEFNACVSSSQSLVISHHNANPRQELKAE